MHYATENKVQSQFEEKNMKVEGSWSCYYDKIKSRLYLLYKFMPRRTED
jgi:hypothetical protein